MERGHECHGPNGSLIVGGVQNSGRFGFHQRSRCRCCCFSLTKRVQEARKCTTDTQRHAWMQNAKTTQNRLHEYTIKPKQAPKTKHTKKRGTTTEQRRAKRGKQPPIPKSGARPLIGRFVGHPDLKFQVAPSMASTPVSALFELGCRTNPTNQIAACLHARFLLPPHAAHSPYSKHQRPPRKWSAAQRPQTKQTHTLSAGKRTGTSLPCIRQTKPTGRRQARAHTDRLLSRLIFPPNTPTAVGATPRPRVPSVRHCGASFTRPEAPINAQVPTRTNTILNNPTEKQASRSRHRSLRSCPAHSSPLPFNTLRAPFLVLPTRQLHPKPLIIIN